MKRLYLILAAALAVLLAGIGLARCTVPAPTVPPAPLPVTQPSTAPKALGAASSSTAATVANDLEIIVPRSSTLKAIAPKPPSGADQRVISTRESDHPVEEPIIIRIRQTATTAASSEASASATVPAGTVYKTSTFDHARLGAFVGTVPGAIAFSYQLAALDVPSDVFGTKLQLGLDVEGNLSQVGGGVSVGSKAFATAGGYLGWNGPGWYVGLGMRF